MVQSSGPSAVCSGLVVSEENDFGGEAESIMYPSELLPRLTASYQGRDEDSACGEKGQIWRTQSTEGLSGPVFPVGRRKHSHKHTAAHSGSSGLRIGEDEPVAVYYPPRAFEDLRELEGAA